MFGPIMEFEVGELNIRLAPLSREVMPEFIANGGMQSHPVTQYLGRRFAPVLEDEFEYFDRMRKDETAVAWGIYVRVNDEWLLIGNTSLEDLHHVKGIHRGRSGIVIFRPEWWGKGIAKHAHRARTVYAFDHLNMNVVRSAVFNGNDGSLKALQQVGYVQVALERNEQFLNGEWVDKLDLEMVNPSKMGWLIWFHGRPVPTAFRRARPKTQAALEWAREHVRFA
jgi:RimJ/RimL family protein N-acetyltransferase